MHGLARAQPGSALWLLVKLVPGLVCGMCGVGGDVCGVSAVQCMQVRCAVRRCLSYIYTIYHKYGGVRLWVTGKNNKQ